MLTDEEIKVLKFIVGDLTDTIGITNGKSNVARFDLVFAIKDISYKEAIDYAKSYCCFCDNSAVIFCKEKAYELIHTEGVVKRASMVVNDAIKQEFVDTIKKNLKGIYYTVYRSDKGKKIKVYCNGVGDILSPSEVSKRRYRVEMPLEDTNDIRSFYRLFASPILWLMWTDEELKYNASVISSSISSFINMMKAVIRIDTEFPFGELVNNGQAIIIGLRCNFETNDVMVGLAQRGGKVTFISSKNREQINLFGDPRFVKHALTDEEISRLNDFGINLTDVEKEFIEHLDDSQHIDDYDVSEQYKNPDINMPDSFEELNTYPDVSDSSDIYSQQVHSQPTADNNDTYVPDAIEYRNEDYIEPPFDSVPFTDSNAETNTTSDSTPDEAFHNTAFTAVKSDTDYGFE